MLAAIQPSLWTFIPVLASMGMATLMFLTAAQSMVQLTTPDGLRGRVSGIYNLVFIGGGAIGGPLVGCDRPALGRPYGADARGPGPGGGDDRDRLRLRRDSRFRLVLVRTRSPWHQVPIRLNLQQAEIQLSAPKSAPLPAARHARSCSAAGSTPAPIRTYAHSAPAAALNTTELLGRDRAAFQSRPRQP